MPQSFVIDCGILFIENKIINHCGKIHMINYSKIIDANNPYTKEELLEISKENNSPLGMFHYLRENKRRIDQTYDAMMANTCLFASLASLIPNLDFIDKNFLGFIYFKNSIENFMNNINELDIKKQNSTTMDFGGIAIFDNILDMQRFYGEVDDDTKRKQITIEVHALISYFHPKLFSILNNQLELKKIYLNAVNSFFENIAPNNMAH